MICIIIIVKTCHVRALIISRGISQGTVDSPKMWMCRKNHKYLKQNIQKYFLKHCCMVNDELQIHWNWPNVKITEWTEKIWENLRPQDKTPGLLGFHYTNILVNKLILLLFFPFVVVFVIYVQVKKCRVTTAVHSVCGVPFTNRPHHVATY